MHKYSFILNKNTNSFDGDIDTDEEKAIMRIEKELEEMLLEGAKNGDEEAVNRLFEKYRNFVFLKARNYFLLGAEKEDLIQEGMIGLLKAIRGYDKNKLTSFKTFASICIKRQLITAIKSANSQKNMALNRAIDFSTTDKIDKEEQQNYSRRFESYICYSPEEIYLTKEQINGLKDYLMHYLSGFEYKVFNSMIEGYSYKDIAEKLNKKTKSIDNAIQRIKRKSEAWLKKYKGSR